MQKQDTAILHRTHRSVRAAIGSPSAPVVWRYHVWLALLVGISIAFSLGFACATPFAAFAAAAALTFSRRDALVLIFGVWLANQLVGFAMLNYPWTASTFAWGLALGVAAVAATLAGQWAARRLADTGQFVSSAVTFLAAFAVYEGVLFAVAVALLGGTEDFTGTIISWIFAVNAAALVGLFALNRFGISVGLVANSAIPLPMSESHA
jgi:hypothetical protein